VYTGVSTYDQYDASKHTYFNTGDRQDGGKRGQETWRRSQRSRPKRDSRARRARGGQRAETACEVALDGARRGRYAVVHLVHSR
jgi:hypothetical protein